MSEETTPSLFKFKKKEVKKIGDFDVLDSTEYTFLVKPIIQDLPQFHHFHKLWNVVEVPGVEPDEQNGIEGVEAVRTSPAWEHSTGFVKDGKFIVTKRRTYSSQTYHGVHKMYVDILERYIQDGYIKDESLYCGGVPQVPQYYSNEKTPLGQKMANTVLQGINQLSSSPSIPGSKKSGLFKMLRNLGSSGAAVEVPVAPENNP